MDGFTTNVLIGVVQALKTPPSFLLDKYFGMESTEESEEIHFERINEKRRIAPFVSPVVAGKVVEAQGRVLRTFKPAYIKDKRVFDPTQPIKRAIGESIGGGQLTNLQRRDAHLALQLQDQLNMLTRRKEVMASEVIRTGKCTIVGDDYPQVIVDFLRDATLTVAALAGGAKWDQTTATPLKNLRAWQKLVRKAEGVNPTDVIMGDDAFENFISHSTVTPKLDQRWLQGTSVNPSQKVVEGGSFQGTIDGFSIYTYSGWYVDPADDTEKEIWPLDQVSLVSPFLEGVRAYGAIKDGKAGLKALPYFPKMWEDDDPAVEYLMLQSAPLIVPVRPNASLMADVV
jgi:hypothetical protein